jgi:hypothetical protein
LEIIVVHDFIEKIYTFVSKPYPFQNELINNRYFQISLALLVFLILWMFEPFDLDKIRENQFIIIAGYGVIAYIIVLIFFVMIPSFFYDLFYSKRWTILKEILFIISVVTIGGTINFFYTVLWSDMPVNFKWFFIMYWETAAVSVFPLIIYTLIRLIVLTNKYRRHAESITARLPVETLSQTESEVIVITSDNDKEKLSVQAAELLYAVARENYVEIVSFNGKLNRFLIRSSLSRIETALKSFPQLVRCHRSYIVNIEKIRKIEGNAQGLDITLKDMPLIIPVSRRYVNILRQQTERIQRR